MRGGGVNIDDLFRDGRYDLEALRGELRDLEWREASRELTPVEATIKALAKERGIVGIYKGLKLFEDGHYEPMVPDWDWPRIRDAALQPSEEN